MRRGTIIFAICMCLVSFYTISNARPIPSMEGTWDINMSVTITGSLPTYANISATFLKNANIHDTFIFDSGVLSSPDLGEFAIYTTDNRTKKVTININGLIDQIEMNLQAKLPPGSTITFTSKSIVMTPGASNTASGNFKIAAKVQTIIKGKTATAAVSISGTLSGVKQANPTLASQAVKNVDTVKVISDYLNEKVIKPLIAPKSEKDWVKLIQKVIIK